MTAQMEVFGTWTTWVGMVAATAAIIGVLLNNRKMILCFPMWILSNAIMFGIHSYATIQGVQGLWPLAIRDLVFFVLAIDGLIRWRKVNLDG